jgi:hypothetical protein
MPEPKHPAAPSFQILADPSGRRRRRMAIAGRVATAVLVLWLAVLTLGGLGLQPLAGLPIVGGLGTRAAAPPALPARVQTAITGHTTVEPTTASGLSATIPGHAKTTPRSRSRSRRSTPTSRKKSPSTTAPGQTQTSPGQTNAAPGPPASTPGAIPGTPGTPGTPGATPATPNAPGSTPATPGAKGQGKGVTPGATGRTTAP